MYDRVNIINELINAYWMENECEPFSASETALFFFLLWRAGMKDWDIPFKCSTSYISRSIKLSRQSVIAARKALYQRGLIYFNKGNINGDVPKYLVTTNPDEWKETFAPVSKNDDSISPSKLTGKSQGSSPDPLSADKTDKLTPNLIVGLTADFTGKLTANLNNQDIKTERLNSSSTGAIIYPHSNKNSGDTDNSALSLDELENILMHDEKWQSSILSLLSNQFPITTDDIKRNISLFFKRQRSQGKESREENDCRNHFYNWLKIQLAQKAKSGHKLDANSNYHDKNDN